MEHVRVLTLTTLILEVESASDILGRTNPNYRIRLAWGTDGPIGMDPFKDRKGQRSQHVLMGLRCFGDH